MRSTGSEEDLLFDPKPERTLRRLKKAAKLKAAIGDENQPPMQTMGDYCKRSDMEQISLGFRPANPVNFDIKGNILAGLRENQFDGHANRDPWDHLTQFSETCKIQKMP
ncbi:putative athila retroelement ORF1 protein [Trifolium medium]|uniref:Putative athila retroelement ORF1 protein n=1 Tax=Trifolium medium TaxID=97028 RepID=A0A392QM93_9FABA|nr:putative athila retroelement ORF1 protein [Trifolium medium]